MLIAPSPLSLQCDFPWPRHPACQTEYYCSPGTEATIWHFQGARSAVLPWVLTDRSYVLGDQWRLPLLHHTGTGQLLPNLQTGNRPGTHMFAFFCRCADPRVYFVGIHTALPPVSSEIVNCPCPAPKQPPDPGTTPQDDTYKKHTTLEGSTAQWLM